MAAMASGENRQHVAEKLLNFQNVAEKLLEFISCF